MELGDLLADEITAWVPFGEDGKVFIKYLTLKDLQGVSNPMKTPWKKHILTDSTEGNRQLGRAAVKDWKNLDVGGKNFPYSPDNCDILMAKSYEFSDFVNGTCTKMKYFIEQKGD